jgi:hypothetical protein
MQSGLPIPVRSYVVGKYDDGGRRKSEGNLAAGPAEANKLIKKMLSSMKHQGDLAPGFVMTADGPVKAALQPAGQTAKLITAKPAKPTKGKKKKGRYAQIEEVAAAPENDIRTAMIETPREVFPVNFKIASGTIKSSVLAILEDAVIMILVYEDSDEISYTPEKGAELTLELPGKRKLEVMYLGSQIPWYEDRRHLLLFIKTGK